MLDMDQNIKTITISEGIKKVFWSMQIYRQAPANHTFTQRSDQVIQIVATKPISISDSEHPGEIKW